MGLGVEIVEGGSVIVMTLTGPSDIAALEPLHDALQVAASQGQTVLLDLRELAPVPPLTDIIDALGPAVATLKLVVPSPTLAAQPPGPAAQVYTSVDAAIDAIQNQRSPHGDTTDAELAAKFHDLSDRYAHMIGHCRQLLHNVENPP
jgi:hypothetical protein